MFDWWVIVKVDWSDDYFCGFLLCMRETVAYCDADEALEGITLEPYLFRKPFVVVFFFFFQSQNLYKLPRALFSNG